MNYNKCMRRGEWRRNSGARVRLLLTAEPETYLPRIRGSGSPQARRRSTRLARVVCLALAVFVPVLTALRSIAAELPGAEQIFQRHVDAVGGVAAMRKPQSLAFRGEADLIPLKAKAPIEILVQAPDRFYLRLKYHHAFFGMIRVPFVGIRQPECGYDGTNGWTVDFERKVEPLSSSEAVFFRALLVNFSPLYASRNFYLTRTLDIERFAEHDCYRVLLVLPTGDHAFEYYDVERGLLVGAIYPFAGDDGTFNIRLTWSDYRPLGCGLRVPYQIDAEVLGQRYVLRAREIQADDAGFSIPASKSQSAPPPVAALKPDSKPAKAIIDRYIEALGGEARIRARKSVHISGQLRHPGRDGLSTPVEIFAAMTNRFFLKVQLPNGLCRQGCDGGRFWRAMGTEVNFATGKDLEQRLALQNFAGVLHAPEGFRSMETLGTINVDGKTCFQVMLVRKNGEVFDEFYDAETGLLRRHRCAHEGSGGGLDLVQSDDDYRRFDSQMVPVRQVYSGPGFTEELTISKVEWDNVPDTVFELPPDLKATGEHKTSAAAK
jgi:hypothetical protein